MKSVFLVASLLLVNASVLSVAVNKCYHCVESSWEKCYLIQTTTKCSTSLLGDTHCYSAGGQYDNGTAVKDVVIRGCIDCSDTKKACEKLELMMKFTSYELLSCNIVCCTEDLCNTVIPQATTTARQSVTHMSPLPVFSMATAISKNIVLFVLLTSGTLALI